MTLKRMFRNGLLVALSGLIAGAYMTKNIEFNKEQRYNSSPYRIENKVEKPEKGGFGSISRLIYERAKLGIENNDSESHLKGNVYENISGKNPHLLVISYGKTNNGRVRDDKSPEIARLEEIVNESSNTKSIYVNRGDREIYNRLKPVMSTVDYLVNSDIVYSVNTDKGLKKIKTKILGDIYDNKHRKDLYYLILGLFAKESSGNSEAYNSYGAHGLGQITSIGLKEYNNFVGKYCPEIIIDGKSYKLKHYTLKDMYNADKNAITTAILLMKFRSYARNKDVNGILTFYSGNENHRDLADKYVRDVLNHASSLKQTDKIMKENPSTKKSLSEDSKN